MNVVYWPNIALGRSEIVDAVGAIDGVQLEVVATEQELAKHLPHAQGLVMANPSRQEGAAIEQVIRSESQLRWLHLISAGQDGVAHCGLKPDVVVTHTPGATANAVGDHAIALLFALMRGLHVAFKQQRLHRWDKSAITPSVTTIAGKRVVILGYGAIGRYLQPVFEALGSEVRVVSRTTPTGVAPDAAFELSQLSPAMTGADVLICAIALSNLTHGLVDEASLRLMKPGSLLVNVGRGEVVDREGLVRCLRDSHLAGAGLDVTDPEPLPDWDETWSLPNVIITPHYGGAGSKDAPRRIAQRVVDVIRERLVV